MIWDPTGRADKEEIQERRATLDRKIERIVKDPETPKREFWNALGITIGALVFSCLLLFWQDMLGDIVIYSFILASLPLAFYYTKYRKLSKQYVKCQLAKELGLWYDPTEDKEKARLFEDMFPEMFSRGHAKVVADQFWGVFHHKTSKIPFSTGLYTFVTGYGRTRQEHHKHYFALQVNKRINARFKLFKESTWHKVRHSLTHHDVDTESIEFNKRFTFSYSGSKAQIGTQIMQALSPATQIELIKLQDQRPSFELLFADDTILFLFEGYLKNNYYTKLHKSGKIDQRDVLFLADYIKKLADIAQGVAKTIR